MSRLALEDKLAALARVPDDPAAWRPYLRDTSNVVVAAAAEQVAARGLTACVPELLAALERLLSHGNPVAADKLCRAKAALVLALDRLGNDEPAPYLRGLRCVQMEPVYGGRVDTATDLRGYCAIALARMRYREAHLEIVPLLLDAEAAPRLAAVRALADLGGERSELALRLKVLMGDESPEVLEAALAGLLALEERELSFVAGLVTATDRTLAAAAALALGSSRLDDAFPLLRAAWEANTDLEFRTPLLHALALTRREEAFTLLLDLLPDGGTAALLACEALAPYATDRKHRTRLEDAIAATNNKALRERYLEMVPPAP